jgi:hypothetical protein
MHDGGLDNELFMTLTVGKSFLPFCLTATLSLVADF